MLAWEILFLVAALYWLGRKAWRWLRRNDEGPSNHFVVRPGDRYPETRGERTKIDYDGGSGSGQGDV